MGLGYFLAVYFFGGITLIPLVLFLLFLASPRENDDAKVSLLKAGEIEEKNKSGLDCFKQGWIIVTQLYIESPDEISLSTQIINESETKSAYSSLYKLVQKDSHVSKENGNITTNDSANSSGLSLDANGVSGANSSSISKKHRYFAVLKHGNLFLYKDETLKDVKHVIVLSHHVVSMWPQTLSEAQLFTKYSAIAIINASDLTSEILSELETPPKGTFFVYTDLTIDKEDWWFALIRATKQQHQIHASLDPNIHAKTSHFATKHMVDLIQNLYSSEGQLQTKWLNGLLGRIFLSLQETDVLRNYLHTKLTKKLNKIKRPGFLDAFQITHIYPGDSAPYFTYPSLKEISPDGTVIISSYISYHGNISIHIATKVNINLGMRFSAREVDVVLKFTLQKFQGPVLFKIKPPPSERIWYTYEVEPIMELKIEPIISSRQMNYTIITNSIHKKLKESIKESLVLPHWDDITFFDSTGEVYRGGIWDRKQPEEQEGDANGDSSNNTASDAKSIEKSISEDSVDKESIDVDDSISLDKSSKFSSISQKIKAARSFGSQDLKLAKDGDDSSQNSNTKSSTLNTLKKIGKWYFKDGKMTQEDYSPPEMILNRRVRRESNPLEHEQNQSKPLNHKPSYKFSKLADNESIYSDESSTSRKYSFSVNSSPIESMNPSFVPSVNPFVEDDIETLLSERLSNDSIADNEDFDNTSNSIPKSSAASLATLRVSPTRANTIHKLHRKPPPESEI